MKCKTCNGLGRTKATEFIGVDEGLRDVVILYPTCGGKGEVESLTEQEYVQTCNAEQLAEFLFRIAYMCSYCGDEAHSSQEKMQQCHFGKCGCQRKDWVEWLKQPHTIKE